MHKKDSVTLNVLTGCNTLHLTIDSDDGVIKHIRSSYHKSGNCRRASHDALNGIMKLAMKHGATAQEIIEELDGIGCPEKITFGDQKCSSCYDAISQALKKYLGSLKKT